MDEILFNDIYDKYVNIVWRTAKYYSENETDADEITQLTFVNLLISYEKIRNKNAIESWLRTTAYRLACSQMRRRKLEMLLDDEVLVAQMGEEVPGPDELIFMRERRRKETELTSTMLEELYSTIQDGMMQLSARLCWKFHRKKSQKRWVSVWRHSSQCCSEQRSG